MTQFFSAILGGLQRFFLAILRFSGTILQESGRGLGRLCFLIFEGIGHGLARVLRFSAPYLIGGGTLWYVSKYQPEFFVQALALVIMVLGFKVMMKGIFGKKSKKK